MKNSWLVSVVTGIAATLAVSSSFGAGPLNLNPNDPDGIERWPNAGAGIPYNPDLGGLGPWDNATATANTVATFQEWQDIATATATYSNNGPMPFDVDATNFAPFIQNLFTGSNVADGFSPVVFDEDGSIFTTLFGISGVLGFASTDTRAADGTPIEAVAFLNGGSIVGGFPEADFLGVMVHEFGHYSGMAHTVVNGQNVAQGDTSGPTPNNTFGNSPLDQVETMYPFLIVGGGEVTVHADDVGFFSFMYPSADFFANSATIAGNIFAPNGATPLTGVNVIARNVNNPFEDAVSAISGDRGVAGEYTINGLTPGADYAVFVDQIVAGGFSTPPINLPGPEEFHNGVLESSDGSIDDPSVFETVSAAAGATATGVDVIFNEPQPGDPLPVGDDGFVQLFLPFEFRICGRDFDALYVNANGNVTFGAPDGTFFDSVGGFLAGPTRIAGLWDDLNPSAGGIVTFSRSGSEFTVSWIDVPEFPATGANSFDITLRPGRILVTYGGLEAQDGLAGVTCGVFATSGLETEMDLRVANERRRTISLNNEPAAFEQFGFDSPNDLSNFGLRYVAPTEAPEDRFEPNDSLSTAERINSLPFDTFETTRYSAISPAGGDVDYFRFRADAGQLVTANLVRGGIDSMIALFDLDGNQLAFDDDGQGVVGGLSVIPRYQVPATGTYVLAVTTWPDFDFDGVGGQGGEGRYVLDLFTETPPPGTLLTLGDDATVEVPLDFDFPYQGNNYSSVYVNSNGNVTFGEGDTDFSESVTEFLDGPARIAPLWDDLSPNQGGFVTADGTASSMTIFFQDVPQFLAGDANSFFVTMNADGTVVVQYGGVDATDGIVGVTEGNGASDPDPTDLSATGVFSVTGTTYEQFNTANPFDLELDALSFE